MPYGDLCLNSSFRQTKQNVKPHVITNGLFALKEDSTEGGGRLSVSMPMVLVVYGCLQLIKKLMWVSVEDSCPQKW